MSSRGFGELLTLWENIVGLIDVETLQRADMVDWFDVLKGPIW
jgi:hypothetical protein